MKRRWVYPGEIPRTLDFLMIQRNAMQAVSQLAMDVIRSNVDPESNTYPTLLAGFKPTFAGGMTITIGDGRLYTVDAVDTVAMGDAGTDSTSVLQQAQHSSTVLTFGAAPATVGESRIDIVQVKRQEYDGNNAILLYYNSTPPYTPWLGSANNGIAQAQDREQKVLISVKAGVAGVTPAVPAPDAGYTTAFQVTIPYGETVLDATNIAPPTVNPFIAGLNSQHHLGTAGSAPKIDLAVEVTGVLPLANGGGVTAGLLAARPVASVATVGTIYTATDQTPSQTFLGVTPDGIAFDWAQIY